MYTALYRTERPETFEQVIGQEHILKVLRNQVATDTVSHAYLFCGTRGTGKTTLARILAKAVNCTDSDASARPCGKCANCQAIKSGSFVDVYEMDAASNRGIDEARDLRDSTNYPPAVGRKKVYIIDEAHMLTVPAFNALLKTIEEPPENVIMILATTDPQKLPQTILSRCQRLDFRPMSHDLLMEHMRNVCERRGVEIDDGALGVLASNADGSVRDGLSFLEQCLATGEKHITRELALEFLGAAPQEFFVELVNMLLNHRIGEALVAVNQAVDQGKDVKQLTKDFMAHYRNLMLAKYIENPEDMLNLSIDNVKRLKEQSLYVDMDIINYGIMTLAEAINQGKYSTQPRILLELALAKLASFNGIAANAVEHARSITGRGVNMDSMLAKPVSGVESLDVERKISDNINEVIFVDMTSDGTQQAEVKGIEKTEEKKLENLSNEISKLSKEELDILWNQICDKAGAIRKSIGALRKKAKIEELGENMFTIKADTDMTKGRLEGAEQLISEVATVIVGRPLRMKCHVHEVAKEDNDKAMIDALNNLFGDKLTIE